MADAMELELEDLGFDKPTDDELSDGEVQVWRSGMQELQEPPSTPSASGGRYGRAGS